ncbi:MAG: 30S ribosomal protein S3 [Candidatus Pacearchaeota archaeon]
MEERKFVAIAKEEIGVKNFIKKQFGKGKISSVRIEYTPIGEKVVISTHKPGIVIGKNGETIENLISILKKRFKMENPHIDIEEIKKKELDAQIVADEIALLLEKYGASRFKNVAYKYLEDIKKAGALGGEIVLSGRLPSERAKTWRFKFGYLKKTGEERKIVEKASSVAQDKKGVIGVEVSILKPTKEIRDIIQINEDTLNKIKMNSLELNQNKKTEEVKDGRKNKRTKN